MTEFSSFSSVVCPHGPKSQAELEELFRPKEGVSAVFGKLGNRDTVMVMCMQCTQQTLYMRLENGQVVKSTLSWSVMR